MVAVGYMVVFIVPESEGKLSIIGIRINPHSILIIDPGDARDSNDNIF